MNKGNFLSDPKGLIFEAYNMEDISEPECRSIFLDWALSLDSKFDPMEEIKSYLESLVLLLKRLIVSSQKQIDWNHLLSIDTRRNFKKPGLLDLIRIREFKNIIVLW